MKNDLFLIGLVLILCSCNKREGSHQTLFTLLSAEESGVTFVNQLTETEAFNIIDYLYFNNGAGVAAGDINNDGLADLYFTSNQQENKLYLNTGDLRFRDITDLAGVGGSGNWSTGVTMADVNGDGLLDIYVCQVGNYQGLEGRNRLFINQGDLTFRDEAVNYGLDFQGFSTQAAFFDHDGDGDLDMYLLNHSVHTSRSYGGAELRHDVDERAGDRLYMNRLSEGVPVFTDITDEAGIFRSQIGYGLGINICDINDDNAPDIYISNDFHENDYLYINNGNGTYTERLTEMIAHTSRSSMGNDIGDFNNDGLLDVVVLDMLPDEQKILKRSGGEDDMELFRIKLGYGYTYQFVWNTLQLNLGGGFFSEIGRLSGIYATDWSWSPLFCDLDNDGLKDLFITNGIYRRANDLDYIEFLTGGDRFFSTRDNSGLTDRELYEKMPVHPNINYLFRNNGDLTFTNRAAEWGMDGRTCSNGSAYADLDNDGDLELVVSNINQPAAIYRNNASSRPENHFLQIAFRGEGLNSRGIGARVTLYGGNGVLMAEQFATRGFMSAVTDVLHFGLGPETVVDSLSVRWPDGSGQLLYSVPADQILVLEQGSALHPAIPGKPAEDPHPLFRRLLGTNLDFRHAENRYEDLVREHLIPRDISREGPALTAGDVNGDGLEDLFVGGASGQESRLYIQRPGAIFEPLRIPALQEDLLTEDVDAAFFDADGDGDPDLYLVRGGNEVPLGDPLLMDLLLINDGRGGFSRSGPEALPPLAQNGSCVRPGDFDGDGDLDLFVGSRSVPGAYGLSPPHFLLENQGGGTFKDVTSWRLEGVNKSGMITDAEWADYDGDGDMDLIVAGEWTGLQIFRNQEGFFRESSAEAGLNATSGWWNCITAADMDGDGDLDLLAGNLGLNSMLKASVDEPVKIYLNDFDNNGSLDQILCSYYNGVEYPVASLDELAGQIGGIKSRFASYSDFAGRTAGEIFGRRMMEEAVVKTAVRFETTLFRNSGEGSFKAETLPLIAQSSPVRDMVAGDFDRDGRVDLVLVGNDYNMRPSLGRQDASYGWCLTGGRDGGFHPLMPVESGLLVNGDARRLVPLRISGRDCLVAAVNNGQLHVFLLAGDL